MPSLHEDLFGMDLLISSGDHVESYLSYAVKHVPLQIDEMQDCKQVFRIKDLLLLSHESST
jgi:hypothetical protein